MEIQRILRAMESETWACFPEKLEQLAQILAAKAASGQIPDATEVAKVEAAQRQKSQQVSASGGAVAVIPLFGTISKRMGMLDAMSGGASLEAFAEEFHAAIDDPNVGSVLLQVDSPGGSVFGVEETAAVIAEGAKEKRVVAHADGLMASAAYWLGSQATEIVVTPSGQAGSIGAFRVHFDVSGKAEQEGVKVTIIRAGMNKAEDSPFIPLSDDALAHALSVVEFYEGQFVDAVASGRGTTPENVRQNFGGGRVFESRRLVSLGMADRVATLEQTIDDMANGRGRASSRVQAVAVAAQLDVLDIAAAAEGPCAQACAERALEVLTSFTAGPADTQTRVIVARGHATEDTTTEPAPTQPAHTAREDETMSAPDTAAQSSGAGTTQDDLVLLERKRGKELRALAAEHKIDAAQADRWVEDGLTVEQAQTSALSIIRGRNASAGDVQVGVDRAGEQPFASLGEQLMCIREAYQPERTGAVDPRLLRLVEEADGIEAATGMGQGTPSDGGYLVAPEFSDQIWEGVNQKSNSLVGMTDSYPVSGESLTFPANAETSWATGSRWGGVRGYWIAEADEITKSKPTLRQVKVEPHELAVLVYVTDKLLRNAPALGSYVNRSAIDEIDFLTGNAIVNGTGAGQPLGLMGSGSLVSVAKEGSQAAATVEPRKVSKMWARLHPNSRTRSVWLHNVDIEPQLDAFSQLVKNVAATENVGGFADKVFDAERRTLKGRPLVACEYCETLGTKGDLLLWDPIGYLVGRRQGVRSDMSIHVRFIYAETAFRFMYEIDGQPWLAEALTPFKGSNKLTTHVSLDTRA